MILLCILFLQSSIFSQGYYENLLSRTVHNHIRTMTTIGDKLVVGGHSYDCDVPYLSIFDETGQQGWQSYPGGGYGWVTINTNGQNSINQIQIFDLTGRLVRTETKLREVNPRISVAGIASGMYYVKLETDEGWLSRKIIIE